MDDNVPVYKLEGLYACGYIRKRTKRMVPRDNPTTEIVTYEILDRDNRSLYVDDYAPTKYYETQSLVNLPVYVKPYQNKTGKMSYTLCLAKDIMSTGEEF